MAESSINYKGARQQLRTFMLCQAERRLLDQNSFAQAADARAATITGAASALAAAAAGLLGVSLATTINWPLVVGSGIGAVSFAVAAHRALESARCLEFHPAGYPPSAFQMDIAESKSRAEVEAEVLEDLSERLEFNRSILEQRGAIIESAMHRLWSTPIYIVLGMAFAWLASIVVPTTA